MLARYQRKAREFDAAYFDGSGESAKEVASLFGGAVYFDGTSIEVATGYGTVRAGMGVWVVRDVHSRTLEVVDHRHFDQHFEKLDEPPHPALFPATDPMRPAAERWDVV